MKRKLEIRWTIFLVAILIASFGLMTGFKFDESWDIQVYDTYYVIYNMHLLTFTGLLLITAYFLTLGLKQLAILNGAMKIISTLIMGMIAFIFIAFTIFTILTVLTTSIARQNNLSYGTVILMLGLGVLFAIRTIEVWKIK